MLTVDAKNEVVTVVNNNMPIDTLETIKRVYQLHDNGNPIWPADRTYSPDHTKWYKIMPEKDLAERVFVRYDGVVGLAKTRYAVFCKIGSGEWKRITKYWCYYTIAYKHMIREAWGQAFEDQYNIEYR